MEVGGWAYRMRLTSEIGMSYTSGMAVGDAAARYTFELKPDVAFGLGFGAASAVTVSSSSTLSSRLLLLPVSLSAETGMCDSEST